MSGSTRINWRQAGGEALFIVVGVGVALLAQAWWEERTERIVVEQHMVNLLEELRSNRQELENSRGRHETFGRDATSILGLIGTPRSEVVDDSLVHGAVQLTLYDFFVPHTAAMSNVVGGGALGLLGDPDLRLQLSTYAQALETYHSYAADLVGFQVDQLRPSLVRLVPLAGSLMVGRMGRRGYQIPESAFDDDASRLRSLEFENLVLMRLSHESEMVLAVGALLDQLDALIEAIESTG